MNRRSFLAVLGAAAAGFAVDPERALWMPGQKTHILPPPKGWKRDNDLYVPIDFKKGDVITISGTYSVNPVTGKVIHGQLQRFVILSDVTGTIELQKVWPEPPRYHRRSPWTVARSYEDLA